MTVEKVTVVCVVTGAEATFFLTVMLDTVVARTEIRRAMMAEFNVYVGGNVFRLVLGAKQLDMYLEEKCYTCV